MSIKDRSLEEIIEFLKHTLPELTPEKEEEVVEREPTMYDGKDVITAYLISMVEGQMKKFKELFGDMYPMIIIDTFSRSVVKDYFTKTGFSGLSRKEQMHAVAALLVTAMRFGAATRFSIKPLEMYLITEQKLQQWAEDYVAAPDEANIEVGPDTVHGLVGMSFKMIRDCHNNPGLTYLDIISTVFGEAFIMGAAAREMIEIWNDPEMAAAWDRQQWDSFRNGGVRGLMEKMGLEPSGPAREPEDDHGLGELFETGDFFTN